MDWVTETIRLVAAICLGIVGLIAIRQLLWTSEPAPHLASPRSVRHSQRPAFLFDGPMLMDASPSAAALIAHRTDDVDEFRALRVLLMQLFPALRGQLAAWVPGDGNDISTSNDRGIELQISDHDGLTRVSLLDAEDGSVIEKCRDTARTAEQAELGLMRGILRDMPQLVWQEDLNGKLLWANNAYLSYADRVLPQQDDDCRVWPGERIFTEIQTPTPGDANGFGGRYALQLRGEQVEHWFDITAVPQDGSAFYFASDANAAMRAERALQDFQQTLSKTFALLSTGIAIFNKRRQLAMFNPALLDMTGLPIAFMSARPTIDVVLDRLREMRMLPEPKNYLSWREQFSAVEAAAKNGTYSERWDLLDGQTFRVTGRPHPDGAVAFLFEDISAEVALTRRFRSEIETGQSVLNALTDAIAVFSSSATLMMTNAAYDDLWHVDGASPMDVQDMRSALRLWKARSVTTALWKEVEDFGRVRHVRRAVRDRLFLLDGRQMSVEVTAISNGMTLVRFSDLADRPKVSQPLVITEQVGRVVGI